MENLWGCQKDLNQQPVDTQTHLRESWGNAIVVPQPFIVARDWLREPVLYPVLKILGFTCKGYLLFFLERWNVMRAWGGPLFPARGRSSLNIPFGRRKKTSSDNELFWSWISSMPARMAIIKRQRVTSVGMSVEGVEPSCVAAENVKWYSCFRKQFGSCSKKLNMRVTIWLSSSGLRQRPSRRKNVCPHKKLYRGPGWGSSVDWALDCKSKGQGLDFQSGHMPGLRARSPVGGAWVATTHWCSLSPFPSV